MRLKTALHLFLVFGLKQAYACLFGGWLLGVIVLTAFWYPFPGLYRYDFLFLAAVGFQFLLLATRLEQPRELVVIASFHLLATGMELFKTAPGIGSWNYPGPSLIHVAGVPLFAGFMYSAVGSYLARVWRVFEFRFSHYPPLPLTVALGSAIYLNFFTHHYIPDLRWVLLAAALLLYGRTVVHFRVTDHYLKMPLMLGFFLVALFIWFAENVSTFYSVWVYPNQRHGWSFVSASKLVSWWLLMMISFVLVSLVHRPKAMEAEAPAAMAAEETV
ncbi:MAG TPA: DUF817 domain-containing protein [Gammaproteobacteria bacterium]